MICFRCGSDVPEGAPQCPNCGQRFAGARKTFTTTTTSFRALEKRRLRAAKVAEKLPFAIGDVVRSRYEVRDLVGRGPLGVVYRVHDQEIEVDVALKVFDPALLEGEDAREAFRRTIRKVRKLSQQNIVRLYDEEQDGDRFYFTMQLLEGLTLRKVIGLRQEKGSRFSAREIEPILGQIAMALSHAHRHTVHGDLKPENVLILPDVLKLTDFGMFEAVPRDRFVAAQEEAGTARYLAPELRAGGAIDPRADIYSLGALFYELLTGQPFGDGAAPPSQVLGMPDEARPGGVDAIVAKATAPEPADRYESAEAFSEALSTYVDAEDLGSIDVRLSGPLLPEDVTRKVRAPAGLQDEDDVPTHENPVLPPAAEAPTPPPEAPAEQSYVEELDGADLDELLEDSSKPGGVRPPAFDPLPARLGPPLEVGTRESTPIGPAPVAPAKPGPEPWFLRSNVGFMLAVVVLVGGVLAGTLYYIDHQRDHAPAAAKVVEVESGTVTPNEPAVVTVVAEPVKVVDAAAVPMPVTAAAPATLAAPATAAAPATVAAPPVAEKVPVHEAVAERTPAHEVKAPAPATEAVKVKAPAPATEAAKVQTPAPTSVAARVEKTPAPASEPRPAAAKPVAADAPVAVAAAGTGAIPPDHAAAEPAGPAGTVSCPAGMLLIKTATFPKDAVKGTRISGAEGVALARAGKAYCIDAYEFPGRGSKPRTNVSFNAAEGMCKGGGKRLCSDEEWRRACVGPGGSAFPYGGSFDGARCNTEDPDGDERSVDASGKFAKCRSAVGAYDMSGNVAEWTADQTVRGGDVSSSDDEAACSAGGRRAPSSARPTLGFRCCADLR